MKLFIAATLVSATAAFSSREAMSMGYLSDISPPSGYVAPKSYSPFGSGMPKAGKDTGFHGVGLPAAAPVAAAPVAPAAQAYSTAPVASAPAPKSYAPWGKKPASAGGAAAAASGPTYSSGPAAPATSAKSYR